MVVAQYQYQYHDITISKYQYHNIAISIEGRGVTEDEGEMDGCCTISLVAAENANYSREYVQTALQLNANLLPTYFLANILNSLSKIFLIIRQIYDLRLLLKNDDDSVNNDDDDCGGDDDEVNACSLNIVQ